jgi:hypothetical protein
VYLSLQAVIFASSLTSSNICIHSQKQYNLLSFLQAVILASILTSSNISVCSCKQLYMLLFQGKLVPKLTLGPFLTLSVRNWQNLQSYLFQEYISLNPSRVEQNYSPYIYKKRAKNIYIETINVNF